MEGYLSLGRVEGYDLHLGHSLPRKKNTSSWVRSHKDGPEIMTVVKSFRSRPIARVRRKKVRKRSMKVLIITERRVHPEAAGTGANAFLWCEFV